MILKNLKNCFLFNFYFTTVFFLAFQPLTSQLKADENKNELKIGISQEFENLNPLIMTMLATTYIYKMVGRNLITLDADGVYVPQLITQIPTIQNGLAQFIKVDGIKTIKALWEIKQNAKWGDATDVTCKDIWFSWQVGLNPNVSIGEKENYTMIKSIDYKKNEPKKCYFTYQKARWDFNRPATFYIVPAHLEEPIFKKHSKQKEGYEKHSNYTTNPTHAGLYNGPYKITELKLSSHIIVEPNPHFYGTAPKIKKIIIKLIPNTSTLEANLRSGTIDMISVLGLSFDQALAFDKKVKSTNLPYTVHFVPSITYEHIDLNLDNPILKDIRVRKALVHAINRKELTESLFEGKQQPALHNITPLDRWYTDDPNKITLYPHSRRTAKKILEDSGWVLHRDGYRYNDGEKLSLSLMTTAGNKVRELVQVFLKSQWKQVGIDIDIKNEPARVFFGETTRKRKYSAMAMYSWTTSPEESPRSTLHKKSIPSEENGWSGQNYPGWINENVNKLIDQIDVEFNSSKRNKFIHQILKHYTEEVPVIPLYYRSNVSVTPKNLRGYQLTGHQFSSTNHIEEWELTLDKKKDKK